jgi:predicted metal-dependent hydrolase
MNQEKTPAQYMRGVELFNDGRFFECHEVWEEIWLKAEGPQRELIHALIQSAVALHHFQRGNLKGAVSVFRRARGKLEKLPREILRLDTRNFAESLGRFFDAALDRQAPVPAFPRIQLQNGS